MTAEDRIKTRLAVCFAVQTFANLMREVDSDLSRQVNAWAEAEKRQLMEIEDLGHDRSR